MRNTMRKTCALTAAVLFFSGVLLAQDNENKQDQNNSGINQQLETSAQQLTETLAGRVNLQEDQKAEIQDAIFQYQAAVVGVNSSTSGTTGSSTDNMGSSSGASGNTGSSSGTTGSSSDNTGTTGSSSSGTTGSTGSTGSSGTTGSTGSTGSSGTTGSSSAGSMSGTTGTSSDTHTGSSVTGSGITGSMSSTQMEDWLNNRIENILQTSQKAQWQVAKADFWNQLRERVSTLQKNSNGMY